MKDVIIKVRDDGSYKMPLFVRLRSGKNKNFKLLYKNKYYTKACNNDVMQLTQVIEALNIKDKKARLNYVYDKACEVLDSDFYGKNVCEFENNRCLKDRTYKHSCNGCCQSRDGSKRCMYLKKHRCEIACLACKFHICSHLRKKGIRYRVNDVLVLRYLLNWKQKVIVYLDFFKPKEQVVNDPIKNSIIMWGLRKEEEKFVSDK